MNQPVVNPLPISVIGLVLLICGVELYCAYGASGFASDPLALGWRIALLEDYGFYGVIVDDFVQKGLIRGERLMRFVTYPFVHYSFTNALFSGVFILAMGKFVGEHMRGIAVLAIFFGSSIVGALAYALLLNDTAPLVGGFVGAYGLIGGFTYLLAGQLTAQGESGLRAFSLIGFLMGIQLLFALLFGTDNTWVAELVGFVTGFLLSSLVRPGGWAQMLERLRQR